MPDAPLIKKKIVSRRDVVLMVVNCRSVKNKIEELSGLIKSVQADVILGTESWLDDSGS